MERYHDYGGREAGPMDTSEHEASYWDKRVDAMLAVLGDSRRRIMQLDEFRWIRETMGKDVYERLNYYERWLYAMKILLIKKGVLTEAEIDARMAKLRAAEAAQAPLESQP